MENNLNRRVDETVEKGKAETEEIRADLEARADEAKADIDASVDRAESDVREHFNEVRDKATDELEAGADEASRIGSTVEHEREEAEDRLVQMLDHAREREAANANNGFFDKIKAIFSGGRS